MVDHIEGDMRERLARVETTIGDVRDDVREIRGDVRDLAGKVDELSAYVQQRKGTDIAVGKLRGWGTTIVGGSIGTLLTLLANHFRPH